MGFFLTLQVLFDAVFLFGILFLFHYSVQRAKRRGEEQDVLKNLQVQEVKENLQELLLTLKQLGQEVSESIREQVETAESRTDTLRKTLARLERDLESARILSGEVGEEKRHLEEKASLLRAAKREQSKNQGENPRAYLAPGLTAPVVDPVMPAKSEVGSGRRAGVGFSSGTVKEVYRLADEEKGIQEIIRRTKLTRAEVQLILNLRGNRFTASN
jgi:DNA repair exonuclease SbcCD ATPase subunit